MGVRVEEITLEDMMRLKMESNVEDVRYRYEALRVSDYGDWVRSFRERYGVVEASMIMRIGYDFGAAVREWVVVMEPTRTLGYVYKIVSMAYLKTHESVVFSYRSYDRLRIVGIYDESGVEEMYDDLTRLVGDSPDFIYSK